MPDRHGEGARGGGDDEAAVAECQQMLRGKACAAGALDAGRAGVRPGIHVHHDERNPPVAHRHQHHLVGVAKVKPSTSALRIA